MVDHLKNGRPWMSEAMLSLLCMITLYSSVISTDPSFDVPVLNVTVVEGKTAILPCSITHLGDRRVVWTDQWSTLLTLEEKRIIDDDRISIERPYVSEWNLHVRDVKHSDRGPYICQINTTPVRMKTINLNVLVPPQIIDHLSSNDIRVREGDTVTLVCNVTGIPTPEVSWYRKSAEDPEVKEKIGVKGEVLIIHNITRYCDDIYECVAYNSVAPAVKREIIVTVEFPPELRLPNKRIGQKLYKETILECVISAYPQVLSVWKRYGKILQTNGWKYRVEAYPEGGHTITLSLRIRDVRDEDYGEYTCFSSNNLGQDAEKMILYQPTVRKPSTTTTTTTTTTRQPHRVYHNPRTTRRPPLVIQTQKPWGSGYPRKENNGKPYSRGGHGSSKKHFQEGERTNALGSVDRNSAATSTTRVQWTLHALCFIISSLAISKHWHSDL